MKSIFVLMLSYFIGAIPFGLIISQKFYGVDIRQQGSGNPGATNVWRVLGKKPGIITLLLDFSKGLIPILIANALLPREYGTTALAGLLAIVGHNWSVFLKGSGGKGVATSAGVFVGLMPIQTMIAIVAFGVVFFFYKWVSLGSMAAAVFLVLSSLITNSPVLYKFLTLVAAFMVFWKHRSNIKRLLKGEEPKVNF
ncbi:MAG: glycerol-3-phosphate 1-O-acyltransferase PlsY [Elusimicrobiota bacterium]